MVEISATYLTDFSVIICTINRDAYLRDAVESVCQGDYPPEKLEIIIVDNGSSEATCQLVEELGSRYQPDIRYIRESKLGFSQARNAGIKSARYEWLVFLDDDAVADSRWLRQIDLGIQRYKDIVGLGGRILLQWDVPQPGWIPKSLEGYLGCNDFMGDIEREYHQDETPFGGNMVALKRVLQSFGGFDTNFGRVGNHLRASGEVRTGDMMKALGKIIYLPEAVVYHRVPADRARWDFFIKRGYHQGIGNVQLIHARHSPTRKGYLRLALVDLRLFLKILFKFGKSLLKLDQKGLFEEVFLFVTQFGHFQQCTTFFLRRQ